MCCIQPKTKINFETDKFYFYKVYFARPALEQEDKPTHDKQRAKQYYAENRDTILEKQKEHKRQHYAENKEKYHQKYLNYKESHQEQIKERGNKLCLCECGKEYKQWNKSSHQKTHQKWLEENKSS